MIVGGADEKWTRGKCVAPKKRRFIFRSGKTTDNALNGKIKKCKCKCSIKKHEDMYLLKESKTIWQLRFSRAAIEGGWEDNQNFHS